MRKDHGNHCVSKYLHRQNSKTQESFQEVESGSMTDALSLIGKEKVNILPLLLVSTFAPEENFGFR